MDAWPEPYQRPVCPYLFPGHMATVHRYSSTAEVTKFQERELELVSRPPEGRQWHSRERAGQVLFAATQCLKTVIGSDVFPLPSPPSERGAGEHTTPAQPTQDSEREACRYWITVKAATYEAVSHRNSNCRPFFHVGQKKLHIACSPRSRWMAPKSPQQPPRQRARTGGKGQGKSGKGTYYRQMQPTQLFGTDHQGYGHQQLQPPPGLPAPPAGGGEVAALAASVQALTEVVTQQVAAADRQMSAITQLSGHVTGLLQHGVQGMPQGGVHYPARQPLPLQQPPLQPLQPPHQVPLQAPAPGPLQAPVHPQFQQWGQPPQQPVATQPPTQQGLVPAQQAA
ncbi:hypothetical protein CYMTET_28836 [Cymbomonas tetramitiformis]|uniref:Uncharacterized protein n=1 Tax=Cymbomonas tetramitiformis TaxID=36881 RepID=A0AAE0FM63_9CHLO|nr:hypothetical protein CYMTET_28836 [Cymbomonas tetramitiformis]